MRKHLLWYFKGFPGASELRAKLSKVETLDQIKDILNTLSTDKQQDESHELEIKHLEPQS
jgi:tRNA-dihydrouridine synthase